ncbi:long-chain-fatty-acid--protein ligase [Ulvibacterium marinum]|uniref:Acyl transferase n=1 Tax=Ulvibacterium marinum TaxID=2419782 RepID=A0A3B0CEY8_9FLAO|nr:acyl transferase [Ulvibacterium marinum]RKN83204.1 acyl transferase [Ulvibacterium marinum]
MIDTNKIFGIKSKLEFEHLTWQIFNFQYNNNPVYHDFCDYLEKTPDQLESMEEIPFMPIEFFRTKKVVASRKNPQITFTSSGTTDTRTSRHHIIDASLYTKSYRTAFGHFYGDITKYCILALLPSYLEREGSSLIYMAKDLIEQSHHPDSGFYLNDMNGLQKKLVRLDALGSQTLLLGVSFALMDLVERHTFSLKNTIIMETGGMKGRRKEVIRKALHSILKKGFGVSHIHSEYGMTELLSQAYSQGNSLFKTPPWMKVLIRDPEDPLSPQMDGKTGGINIIDLANIYSCSFIATQDLGKRHSNGSFEVLGRFDHSDIRGCNLMVL